MDYHKSITKSFLLLLCIMFFWIGGCSDRPSPISLKPRTFSVPVIQVKARDIPISYITTGSVISDARVQVSSRITGFILDIAVREGDPIKKDQLLITLDDADVKGAIEKARAAVAKAKSALDDAEIDVKRYEILFSRGSASDNALRKVRLRRDVAKDSLSEAESSLKTALAHQSYIRIISPVDGIVVDRHKRKGDLATPGVPILTVESADSLLFETYIAEARVGNIHTGDKTRVEIDVLKNSLKGAITRIVPSGDPVTRRYLVKIALPDVPGLMPGMFGRVHFVIGSEKSPVVPRLALVTRGGLTGVFVLDSKNSVRFRWLRTSREWPDRLEVSAGLKGGERIVAAVPPDMRDGDLVEIKAAVDE